MPLFICSLRQAHDAAWPQRRKWSNTFWVNGSSPLDSAALVAAIWQTDLRAASHQSVFAYEVYAHDNTPGTDSFATVGIPESFQRGTIADAGSGERYLTKACVRVPMRTLVGRPSFKFWRPGLHEGEVVAGTTIISSLSDLIIAAFSGAVETAEGQLVDPDGQTFTAIGNVRLTTREFGRYAGNDLPEAPPLA
jgi:hypothetical protein